ncbi:hypothetical protein DSCOOX_18330 [Desulfosarcina ovata subsp. ovata]|uniref:Uncharacterized protein n=1 Tax=Desulfosarcina ovata subsp. ovata TaxID=2752305 RepID=A0A5K8A7N5_9BACT|nr:hypothetical protein DSCOOX_18330 [Desulfosarcina ovata subsp. ovata]
MTNQIGRNRVKQHANRARWRVARRKNDQKQGKAAGQIRCGGLIGDNVPVGTFDAIRSWNTVLDNP